MINDIYVGPVRWPTVGSSCPSALPVYRLWGVGRSIFPYNPSFTVLRQTSFSSLIIWILDPYGWCQTCVRIAGWPFFMRLVVAKHSCRFAHSSIDDHLICSSIGVTLRLRFDWKGISLKQTRMVGCGRPQGPHHFTVSSTAWSHDAMDWLCEQLLCTLGLAISQLYIALERWPEICLSYGARSTKPGLIACALFQNQNLKTLSSFGEHGRSCRLLHSMTTFLRKQKDMAASFLSNQDVNEQEAKNQSLSLNFKASKLLSFCPYNRQWSCFTLQ